MYFPSKMPRTSTGNRKLGYTLASTTADSDGATRWVLVLFARATDFGAGDFATEACLPATVFLVGDGFFVTTLLATAFFATPLFLPPAFDLLIL
jgi:hypothetical protein